MTVGGLAPLSRGGVEPHLTLAFALRSTPGGYALLLGAGTSVSSGVPSAWGVQDLLIRELASMRGEDPGEDAFAWYARAYGQRATYDGLLAALTRSQTERQALLRRFFEPNAEEREQGLKQPSPAHHAIARLVAAGLVRIILTTNFERLLETALREAGVQPTIVTNPAGIAGLKPLHTLQCLVVHLHGDYLDPTGMLNTAEELGAYPEQVDDLLHKILPEYGLVIVGWSATWDTALRAAITRHPDRFFATYWVDPFPLSEEAEALRAHRDARYVQADADAFLGQLADATDSLAETGRRHPLTVPVAVATAKRELAGGRVAIPLHDTLRGELEALHRHDVLQERNFDPPDWQQAHDQRLARLAAALELPAALVTTTAYWGDANTDSWWIGDISRLGARPRLSGVVPLINLLQLPATVLLYAAGGAAAAGDRADLVVRLLTEPTTHNDRNEQVPIAQELHPKRVTSLTRAHRWLHEFLRPLLEGQLALGPVAYLDASERFEYLRLVQDTFQRLKAARRHEEGPAWDRSRQEYELRVANAANVPGQPALAREEQTLRAAQAGADEKQRDRARLARPGLPHFRMVERGSTYRAAPAEALAAELDRQGVHHPLVQAGLCDGDPQQLHWAMTALDDQLHALAKAAAWSTVLPQGGGYIPQSFVLDEAGQTSKDR